VFRTVSLSSGVFHCTRSNGICMTCKLSANLYDIYHCCVYSEKTPDGGQRNCPKHVEFYSKNKFEKLVHLVGFIIRICHDARSPERQIRHMDIRSGAEIGQTHQCARGIMLNSDGNSV